MAREYKLVNAKSRGLQVFQAFDTNAWRFDYHNFVVADAKKGPTYWDREYPCRTYGDAMRRLEMRREQAAWQAEKSANDKAAKAADRAAKAAAKAAAAETAAEAKKAKVPKPDPMLLLRQEMQAEMQAAIAKGIADALATMQATAQPTAKASRRKQATAS